MHNALMEMAQNQSEAVAYNTKAAKSRLDDRRETNSRMLKRDFNKSGISHVHSTKTGPDGSKHDHFDIGKHTKVISTHNSYKVLHKGKETHYQGDPEYRDNRNRVIDKVLQHVGKNESIELDEAVKYTHVLVDKDNKVVAAADSEKGIKQSLSTAHMPPMSIKDKSTLKIVKLKKPANQKRLDWMMARGLDEERAAWVPESIADEQVEAFMEATVAAIAEGEDTFVFEGKHYKAKTKKEDKLDPVGQEDDDIDNDGDVDSSDKYLKKRRSAIKKRMAMDEEKSVKEAAGTAQHGPDDATSDTFQKQMGGGRSPREKEFVDMHKVEVALDVNKIHDDNKNNIEAALKQTPPRLGDQRTGDTSFVNPVKADIIDGITKALQQMKTNS